MDLFFFMILLAILPVLINYLENNNVIFKLIDKETMRISFPLQFNRYKELEKIIYEYHKNFGT